MTTDAADIAPPFAAGLYDAMPEDVYHADPVPGGSLSNSGAKTLLACPAKFRYVREHGSKPTDAMKRGTAAHTVVLGSGPPLVTVNAPDYHKTAARERRDAIEAEGGIPLLPHQRAHIDGMAEAIRRHPTAGKLFDPDRGGKTEQSLFWIDARTGIWRRCRVDFIDDWTQPGLVYVVDYKTITKADRRNISQTVAKYGYHCQDSWYGEGVRALGLADDPIFMFVFQETEPPYLVTVVELDYLAKRIGHARNLRAIDKYVQCTAEGHWPAYADDDEVVRIGLPYWATRTDDEE